MSKFQDLKEQCYEANIKLPKLGLVTYTFGNVSVADGESRVFAIKPSGMLYDQLKPEDMVVLDFDNKLLEGRLMPSSDTKTHAYLYRSWHGIGSIVHTHATFSVAWSQAQKDIPIFGTTHADHLTVDIPCAAPMDDDLIKGDYEHNTGKQIVDCLKERGMNPLEVEMILLGNHGPFTWGSDADKAVYNSKILEELAKMAYLTLQINPDAPRLKQTLIEKHYQRKHGDSAYYGQK